MREIENITLGLGGCVSSCSGSRTTPLPPTQYSLSAKRKPTAGALGDLGSLRNCPVRQSCGLTLIRVSKDTFIHCPAARLLAIPLLAIYSAVCFYLFPCYTTSAALYFVITGRLADTQNCVFRTMLIRRVLPMASHMVSLPPPPNLTLCNLLASVSAMLVCCLLLACACQRIHYARSARLLFVTPVCVSKDTFVPLA